MSGVHRVACTLQHQISHPIHTSQDPSSVARAAVYPPNRATLKVDMFYFYHIFLHGILSIIYMFYFYHMFVHGILNILNEPEWLSADKLKHTIKSSPCELASQLPPDANNDKPCNRCTVSLSFFLSFMLTQNACVTNYVKYICSLSDTQRTQNVLEFWLTISYYIEFSGAGLLIGLEIYIWPGNPSLCPKYIISFIINIISWALVPLPHWNQGEKKRFSRILAHTPRDHL